MTTKQTPVTFEAYDRSLQLLRAVLPALRALTSHDPDLAKQLRRAAQSVGQNIAEGNRRTGKDRRHLFRIALGSAAEALELADRVRAMTYRLSTR